MRVSLFSQSLFALPLTEAIALSVRAGYSAIEIACVAPHLDVGATSDQAEELATHIRSCAIDTAALSLFNDFTTMRTLQQQISTAANFIRMAPIFNTEIVKLTPGPPASASATDDHWRCLADALSELIPVAEEIGVRLAFETHMWQLTDTLGSTQILLDMAPSASVGVTLDFSNMSFAGENMADVVSSFGNRILHTHVKNGHIEHDGSWSFTPLDVGVTDYLSVLPILHSSGYDGYLSVECLQPEAASDPVGTVRRDLSILRAWQDNLGLNTDNNGASIG